MKQVVQPTEVFDPHAVFGPGSYRQAIRVADTVYISGQAAIDVDGSIIGRGDVGAQAEAVLRFLVACLRDAGATTHDLVKVTTYYLDRAHRGAIADARRRHLGGVDYVHTGVIIDGLADPDLLLEIEAIAVVGAGDRS
jgi:enamine deaminase RidA (YjgF/YER057c/UK114 family)